MQIKLLLYSLYFTVFISSHSFSQNGNVYLINTSDHLLQDSLTFSSLIDKIENKYEVRIYFQQEWIPHQNRLAWNKQLSLKEQLDLLLQQTGMHYWYVNSYSIILGPKAIIDKLKDENATIDPTITSSRKSRYELIGDPAFPSSNPQIDLLGTVMDPLSGKVVNEVEIAIDSLQFGVYTDEDGKFQMNIPQGYHTVTVRAVGYAEVKKYVRAYESSQWNIELDMEAYKLPEVLLQAQATDRNVSGVATGLAQLNIEEIQRLPAFLGEADVVQAVLSLPGVNTVGEGASGFNVRGGGIDQNLILLNESILFNASHVLGFISLFPPDLVEQVDLYKGYIPATYGGRVSSVMDVKMKTGNRENIQLKGGVGFIGSRLALEGPLNNDKTTFTLGIRTSYSDWFLNLVDDPDVNNSEAWYGDLYGSITHRWNEKHISSASIFGSRDRFQFSEEFGFTWRTNSINVDWRYLINQRFSLSTSILRGNYQNTNFELAGQRASTLANDLVYTKLKQYLIWSPLNRITFTTGWEAIQYDPEPERRTPNGDESTIREEEVEKDKGREIALFTDVNYTPFTRLSISAGIRYSFFHELGPSTYFLYDPNLPLSEESIIDTVQSSKGEIITRYNGWEPRVSIRANVDDKTSVKLSYHRLYQYIHLISNTTASTPVDIWQVSNVHITPQFADQLSIGIFRNFFDNRWESSVELYYKWLNQIKEYKNLADLFLNPTLETEILEGQGRAYGVELYLKRSFGNTTGWLSYTYSRTERLVAGNTREETLNQGDWFPANFDQPHQLSLNLNHRINKRNTVALNFTYRSGRPITAPVGDYVLDGVTVPHYSFRNQFRIPDYHRLDISYTLDMKNIKRKRYKDSFTFSIYNLYGRRNAFSVFFRQSSGRIQVPQAFQLSILGTTFPSITYNFRF